MSKFPERKGAALLVIDVQNNVVEDAWRRDETIKNINLLVEKARAGNTKVIWIQHSDEDMQVGSQGWQIVPELLPLDSEPIVRKMFRSSFEETELESLLEGMGASHLYISGAQSNYCVRHTTHAALERGYDVTLIEDAHTTSDDRWGSETLRASAIIDEQNRSCLGYQLPGRKCTLATTEEVVL